MPGGVPEAGLTPPRASQQEYADFLTKMTGIYKESAKKVTNKDVKTAFTDVLDDLDKLIDLLNTDENASASPDY